MRIDVGIGRLCLLITLLGLSHATSATFYVSTGGSDSNPGTAAQPFRTITRAYGAASVGTTILVGPGTYTDYSSGWGIHLGASGTASSPIVLRSQTPGAAVIDGQNASDRNVGFFIDGNYNILDGFEIKNGPSGGITIWANNNQILNCNIHNNGNPVTLSTGGQDGVYSAEDTSSNTYIGNYIHHNGRPGNRLDHGLYLCGNNEVVINNILLANAGSGVQVAGYTTVSNLKIYNNVMAYNGTQGIILWQALNGVDIKNNIFYANGTYGINTSDAHGGGVNIDHNLFFGNALGNFNLTFNGSDVSYSLGSAVYSDPGLVNLTSAGFDAHLAAGSPAIQAALNLYSSFTTDMAGAARPASGAWDLGTYKYGSSGTTGTTDTTPPTTSLTEPANGATLSGPLPTVTVAATIPTAVLGTTHYGVFRFRRTGSTSAPLTVNYSLGGTAIKWNDYYRYGTGDMPSTTTIPAGASAYRMPIVARDNQTYSNPETVTINLSADPAYQIGTAASATMAIVPRLITAIRTKTLSGMKLIWHSTAGRTYRVVYRDTLTASWADLSGDIVATASSTSWTDTTSSTVARRFYRVHVLN
jgi:hypothetical protein